MLRFRTASRLARTVGGAAIAAAVAASTYGSSTFASGASLTLVAYSTPATAYGEIIPAFQKTLAGRGVNFTQSYGPSGTQANLVASGLHADIVHLALEPDMSTLVAKGMVSPNWHKSKYRGFVADSIIVFGVRKGNPKHIHTWSDLLKPGVSVITPNPFTSGGARWNVMAAYGAQIEQHKSRKQAIAYLTKLFSHVTVQDASASKELQTFGGGEGDVMLGYENELITAQQKGVALDYVIPPQSILVETPAAVTTETKFPKQAKAFLSFLYSKTAQRIFGRNGYRPVRSDVAKHFHFRNPKKLFTIRTLGAWPKLEEQFFDPNTGIMAKIERGKGVTP